jgi:hypothetical protein
VSEVVPSPAISRLQLRRQAADVLEMDTAHKSMPIINIYEVKTQLSRLVEQAGAGKDVIIARGGKLVQSTARQARW